MTSHDQMLRAVIGFAAALSLTLVSPPPAHAATVTLNTSRTSAGPGTTVKFSGTAAGAASGAPVTLQRRLGSGSWSAIKTGGTVSASDTYSYTIYVAVGAYSYRAKVGSASYSPARTVSGTYGRNVSVPAAGSPFTLSTRLPQSWSRTVKAQVSTNGTSWTDRGKATSNSGLVGVRTYLFATSYVRVIAPATGSLPTWVGPKGKVTIGTDPVIKRILDDTNAERTSHGKPALKTSAPLNKVAGNWAYYMHQKCKLFHNTKASGSPTNYWEQYPSGWMAAAENIAQGYSYTTVVQGWLNSPPHHTNIDGNYTHIGIGYYFGSKCTNSSTDRFYVQNFARY